MDVNVSAAETSLTATGDRLRRARETVGLSREQLSKQTKILERHLEALEAGRFANLPGRTYAIGFSRTYARAVGLDEEKVAAEVRNALGDAPRAFAPTPDICSPAPKPFHRGLLAVAAGLSALALSVAVLLFWRSNNGPIVTVPLATDAERPVQTLSRGGSASNAGLRSQDQVLLAAEARTVWVQIKDSSGKQIMQKELAPGETYAIPMDANDPRLSTAHPEALAISVGGRRVPRLAARQTTLRNVPVSGAALLGRQGPGVPTEVVPQTAP
jgi:transcriptional regulator with XRE-family HTH domain